MWEVHGTTRVTKNLNKLQKNICEAINKGLSNLGQNPFKGKTLKGYSNLRSLAITTPGGEYRIIYTLKPEDKVVLVILVGPREGFYEQLKKLLE
nr:putative cytotoxic translational repressor of toxin-antitoxin stability system [uncultured bacterium]